MINKPWTYTLCEHKGAYFLNVICGSVAIYELKIKLSKEEIGLFKKEGVDYVDRLASKISNNPDDYLKRLIK